MSASGTTLDADRRTAVGMRLGRLAQAVDRAAERHGPEPRALLLVLGAVAVGAGVAAIGLGWYGAAHSPYLFQEVPYVISGGLLGVALVVAGAALVIGSWVVRLVHETQHAAGRLDQIADLLARQQPAPAPAARFGTETVADHATGAQPAAPAMPAAPPVPPAPQGGAGDA